MSVAKKRFRQPTSWKGFPCVQTCWSLAAVILLMTTVQGQRRELAEADIDGLLKRAQEERKSLPHRVKNTYIIIPDSPTAPPNVESSSTTEYLPPDRSRTVLERQLQNGPFRSEIIRIGNERFIKQPTGEWKLDTPPLTSAGRGDGSGSGSSSGTPTAPPKVKLECEYVGANKVNGIEADLYQKVRSIVFAGQRGRIERRITKKYWFNKQGQLLKQIDDDEFVNSNRIRRIVVEYEYDPTIKIERPITNQ